MGIAKKLSKFTEFFGLDPEEEIEVPKEEVKARNIREKTQVKDTRARRANPSQDLATTWASTICKMQLKMTLMRSRILKISKNSFKKSIMTKMSWPIWFQKKKNT